MITRADVIKEARSWIGVRWLHQGRSRAGVDCVGLVICVNRDLFGSTYDVTGYNAISTDEQMLQSANAVLVPSATPSPGDVVIVGFGKQRHMCLLGDYPYGGLSMIHAYLPSRGVVENRFDDTWRSRVLSVYSFPGVEEWQYSH